MSLTNRTSNFPFKTEHTQEFHRFATLIFQNGKLNNGENLPISYTFNLLSYFSSTLQTNIKDKSGIYLQITTHPILYSLLILACKRYNEGALCKKSYYTNFTRFPHFSHIFLFLLYFRLIPPDTLIVYKHTPHKRLFA